MDARVATNSTPRVANVANGHNIQQTFQPVVQHISQPVQHISQPVEHISLTVDKDYHTISHMFNFAEPRQEESVPLPPSPVSQSPYSSSASGNLISQPSDSVEGMDHDGISDITVPSPATGNRSNLQIGTKAEMDPHFHGPAGSVDRSIARPVSVGEYDNVPMDQGNPVVCNATGPESARYMEPQVVRHAGGQQGIKAAVFERFVTFKINVKLVVYQYLSV